MGGGLSRGEIVGVIVGPILFVLLIVTVVHVLLIVLLCRRLKAKKSTYLTIHTNDDCDPQFGGNYRAFSDAGVEHSYEDPDRFCDKNTTSTSYRERFQNRMV